MPKEVALFLLDLCRSQNVSAAHPDNLQVMVDLQNSIKVLEEIVESEEASGR